MGDEFPVAEEFIDLCQVGEVAEEQPRKRDGFVGEGEGAGAGPRGVGVSVGAQEVVSRAAAAGLILLARDVDNPRQFSLDFIDVGVERNAYGRQRESFEARGSASLDGRATPVEMVFIRAPRIRRVGAGVETLARHGDEAVLARQGSVLVATFHPELTDDPTVHEYFCSMVRKPRAGAAA